MRRGAGGINGRPLLAGTIGGIINGGINGWRLCSQAPSTVLMWMSPGLLVGVTGTHACMAQSHAQLGNGRVGAQWLGTACNGRVGKCQSLPASRFLQGDGRVGNGRVSWVLASFGQTSAKGFKRGSRFLHGVPRALMPA